MSRFIDALIQTLGGDCRPLLGNQADKQELRLEFKGPPEVVLEKVLDAIIEAGGLYFGEERLEIDPVLLPKKSCQYEPASLRESGQCSNSHMVAVRTKWGRYLSLIPPDNAQNASILSCVVSIGLETSELGLASHSDFFNRLLTQSMERIDRGIREPVLKLSRDLLRDEMVSLDLEANDSACQWSLLSELFDRDVPGDSALDAALATMGLFFCTEEQLEYAEHKKVLKRLAEFLESEGIGPAFEVLKEHAPYAIHDHLDACLEHIYSHCVSGSDFTEAPATRYSPLGGKGNTAAIPAWWKVLTLDIWSDLLDAPAELKPLDDMSVKCTNLVMPRAKGIPEVVQSQPEFEVFFASEEVERSVSITRRVGRKKPEDLGTHDVRSDGSRWEDPSPPEHDSHLEYIFQADEIGGVPAKPMKIKLIALDMYEAGLVPYCRSAAKLGVFKKVRKKKRKGTKKKSSSSKSEPVRYVASVELHGMGTHQLDLYTAVWLSVGKEMAGMDVSSESDEDVAKPIRRSSDAHSVCVIDADEECNYHFLAGKGLLNTEFQINIVTDDDAPVGVESEFDRLVIESQKHLRDERGGTTIEPPSARCSDLQRWIIEGNHSYRPLIIGPDFERCWVQPDWEKDAIISGLQLLQDPRPSHGELQPTDTYLKLRAAVVKGLCTDTDGDLRLLEEVQLGNLIAGSDDLSNLILEYVEAYTEWLKNDHNAAAWSDVILACKASTAGASLDPSPYAILLSPLHPLRLAWHCRAQESMRKAIDDNLPCPAASTFDPHSVPDCMALPMRDTSGGTSARGFMAVDCNSDYWHVMWSIDCLDDLESQLFKSLFGRWFGVEVDGLASGFSGEQVKRSISEIRRIYPAKSALRLMVRSDSSGISSFDEGIEAWAMDHLGPDGDDWFSAGAMRIDLVDMRDEASQPIESQVARMSEISGRTLDWFTARDTEQRADLAILAHLGTDVPRLERHKLRSAMDKKGLSRWRIRRQTGGQGNFIAETRVAKRVQGEQGLSAQICEITWLIESEFAKLADAHVFAPNLTLLSSTMQQTSYCAVSSSVLDPACFFGQMENFYLWDYDLPAYSRRAGENSGYYMLASESSMMGEAITAGLDALNKNKEINKDPRQIQDLLFEIASRGMPTLKNLTTGGTAALGELGMLVALRILQGDFIQGNPMQGVVPVRPEGGSQLTLVLPVDPFLGHFDALRRSMSISTMERPDLLIACITFEGANEPQSIRLTPVEVKARTSKMSSADRGRALKQAASFGSFLSDLRSYSSKYDIWGQAWRHLLCSWLDYGFRVYGQLDTYRHDPKWCESHQNVLSAILENDVPIVIDDRGRLLVVDQSKQGDLLDLDHDGFKESLIISQEDAHKIIVSPAESIIPYVVEKIGDWELCLADVPEDALSAVSGTPQPAPPQNDRNVKEGAALAEQDQDASHEPEVQGPGSDEDEEAYKSVDESVELPQETDSGDVQIDTCSGVLFPVGKSIGGFTSNELSYHPSNTALSQLNIGVIGDLGTGKTQLLKALLYNLHQSADRNRGVSPNVLIFDYKKDYSKKEFVEATNAKVINPARIPLNLFDTTSCTNEINPQLERSRFFIDVLSRIYSGIGNVQSYRLKNAIMAAYEQAELNGHAAPTIYHVLEKYKDECGNNPDSLLGIIDYLVELRVFVDSHEKAIPFEEFFKGVVVINLGMLGPDNKTKNMLVAIFLNLFYEYMLNVEKKPFVGTSPQLRAIDSYLLVDEATNIMQYEFDVLKNILLQGREFGVGVVLASQFPSHFKTKHENYAESLKSWFIHQVPDISVSQLQSMGFTAVDNAITERIKELKVHECLYQSLDVDAEFMHGYPFYKLIADDAK